MKLTFAVAVLLSSICASCAEKGCGGKPADVVFVLDSSASIGKENFRKQINFTKNVVDLFDIGKAKTRVGITLFSTDVHPYFGLTAFDDKTSMENAIDRISYKVGGTGTDKALRYVRENEFQKYPRHEVPQIAIVLTDGQSYNTSKTIAEAHLAHASGITVFVIGIGAGVDMEELSALASDPDASHLFHIRSHSALEKIKDTLAIETCKEIAYHYPKRIVYKGSEQLKDGLYSQSAAVEYVKPTPSPKVIAAKPVDPSECILSLIVGVDTNGVGTRNTRNILGFISEITDTLSTGPGKLRTAQLMTECAGSSGRQRSKSYAPLIKKMRYQIREKSRSVKSAGLLFINSQISDVQNARNEVKRAKFVGFRLIIVDIGRDDNQKDISRLLGVKPNSKDFSENVFKVSEYGKLALAHKNVTNALSEFAKCV